MSGGQSDGRPLTPSHPHCNIVEKTPLNSPKANVVASLKVGSILEVALTSTGKSLVAKVVGGEAIAGSLTPMSLVDIVDCMARGRHYVAVVTQISGGFCEVEIRPK